MNKTLFIGGPALDNLIVLLTREGFVGPEPDLIDTPGDGILPTSNNIRISNKRLLLFSLLLFDNIDSTTVAGWNLDRLIDVGLLKKSAYVTREKFFWRDPDNKYSEKYNQEKDDIIVPDEFNFVYDLAESFIYQNRQKIFNYFKKKYGTRSEHTKDLIKNFNIVIKTKSHFDIPWIDYFVHDHIIHIKNDIARGIYISLKKDATFYHGGLACRRIISSEKNYEEDAMYILNLDLGLQLSEFPIPHNIKDVLFLRQKAEIKSFREVFFTWLDYIKNGELEIALKIKKDILAANKSLEKFRTWEKSQKSLFYCTINALVNQIPYLSNIIGVISPFKIRKMIIDKEKSSWVMLVNK